MIYGPDDMLMLSGLQHFAFCRRQWALIHIENLWAENLHTVEGDLFHSRAHNEKARERRGDTLILRGLPVFSHRLGVSGKCDVVEFTLSSDGVSLEGEEGKWLPYPIEYKKGKPKENDADELQLCAQAVCLEEMLCCDITQGALFYGEPRRRKVVDFTSELRARVESCLEEMHRLYSRGYTPRVKMKKGCGACSLKDLCLPGITKGGDVEEYLKEGL